MSHLDMATQQPTFHSRSLAQLSFIAAITTCGLIAACGGSQATNTQLGSATPIPTPTPTGSNSSFFTVTASFENTPLNPIMHDSSSFSKLCQFASTDTTKTLSCLLDVAEFDLYFNDITLNWNAPVGMCNYVVVSPFAFLRFPIFAVSGIPSDVDVAYSVNYNSSTSVFSGLTNLSTNPITGAATLGTAKLSHDNKSVVCTYDYTQDAKAGPGCCSGRYTEVRTTAGTAEIETVTFTATASATQGDYVIIQNTAGLTYAIWLDIDANGTVPTGANYVSANVKIKVPIVTGGTAAANAASALNAINTATLSNITAVNSGAGVLTFTQSLAGTVTDPVTHNKDDTAGGSLAAATSTQGTAATSTTSTGLYSGNAESCFSGPSVDPLQGYGFGFSIDHRPVPKAYYTFTGVNDNFKMRAPIKFQHLSNMYVANYASSAPASFVRPYYGFYCYDSAKELVGSVELQIRDWNSQTELSKGSTGNPDSGINNFNNWADFNTAYPAYLTFPKDQL